MYIFERRLKALKIKNFIAIVVAVFEFILSVAYIAYMCYHYWGDWFTLQRCASMPESIFWVCFAPILLLHGFRSNKRIGEAYFFGSYFEGDLSGIVDFEELADISGYTVGQIKKKMKFFRNLYMKNYDIQKVDGAERIVLYSKKVECQCRKCGAPIEKSVYFTGNCGYCGSSDLHAKVLTDNRFYSISNTFSEKSNKKKSAEIYRNPKLNSKRILFVLAIGFALFVAFIGIVSGCLAISHANDHEYIIKQILAGEITCSSEEAARELVGDAIFGFGIFLMVLPIPFFMNRRLRYIGAAEMSAPYLVKSKKPFVDLKTMPTIKKSEDLSDDRAKERRKISAVRNLKEAISHDYLMNCSFEKHDDGMKIALARKIVKDACPYCSAPIADAVDENYVCKHCGRTIMGVVVKQG